MIFLRLYDWEMDEYGGLRPVIKSVNGKNEEELQYANNYHHAASSTINGGGGGDKLKRQQNCANDSFILETILKKYNRHKIPGDSVTVQVEVWVQEITTISDITSDFQVNFLFKPLPRKLRSFNSHCSLPLFHSKSSGIFGISGIKK